ncbi:MAG: ROK family transcriptional regulator [Phenylobacterium sp.]|uniref:ROK family transcriptional regulator n=1 Tax=Phenylobacterium sp. TaxID=1871053 RepID=UPI001A503DAB|nr:ROK family transcriptional regulator [Phenylobacterium sp.]MBL8554390.1 ROK family transcriptional regulator [Phenylobacterium sp.]
MMPKLPGGSPEPAFRRPDLSRRLNRSRILLAIRRHAPVTRQGLEQITGLAAGTVQVIVDELLAEGLLVAARVPAAGASGRGRPRLLLELNSRAALIAGVGVFGPDRMQFEIADLGGGRIAALESSTPLPGSGPALADAIAGGLDQLAGQAGVAIGDLAGVGVGLPGLVDSVSGVVRWAPGIVAESYPLADVLQARLGVPVNVDNTANVAARAEYWFSEPRTDDFAVVLVGQGVGMGFYVAGALVTGPAGMAGEIGHMKMGLNSPIRCVCGAWDCVTAHVSQASIVRQGLGLGFEGRPDNWRAATNEVLARAQSGDPRITAILDGAAGVLGKAVANVATLIGPARIVIQFEAGVMAGLMGPALTRAFEAQVLPQIRERTELVLRPGLSSLGHGAAAFALERIYAGPQI